MRSPLFLAYLGGGVIVGHHIGHDIEALNCACERHFGFHLATARSTPWT